MTDRYAVFGNPLSHSKSPLIHMTFARDTGEDIDYGKIESPLDGFGANVETFRAAGGRGINITMPFKLEAFGTRRMPRAEHAGAANCLKFEGSEIIAENFDGVGLVRDIEREPRHLARRQERPDARRRRRGAWGHAADPRGRPARLTIVNRTRSKAEALTSRCSHVSARSTSRGALRQEARRSTWC